MIKRLISLSIITIIMVAGIVQVRSIDRIHANTNPLSSAYNVIKKDITQEKFSPSVGEVIGVLSIPRLNSELGITEGNEELGRGISHEVNSAFPSDNGLIILNLMESSVLNRASEIQNGDEIIINLPYGSFTYQVKESYPSSDFNPLNSNTECLILTIPDNSYTIYAERVKATN